MENAEKENFELAMLDDYVVLYTGSRIDRNTVPENLFCYDVRHDDDCQGIACEVKPHVLVNHWGTILSKTEIPMTEGGSYYPREDMNYLGETLTVEEYMRLDMRQALLRSRVELLCENYKIDSRNLKWYAAFHNESHHPHVHLVVYSTKPSEGYLTKKGIEAMRSAYAHDIFRQEFMSIYEKKTKQREALKEQADKSLLFLMRQIQHGVCHNEKIARQIKLLSERLDRTGGKKVYGYLKADVKAVVNGIVDELAGEEPVAACYRAWLESKNEILRYYKDTVPELPSLSEQKELKSIKNMVIREAVRFGQGYLYAEEEGLPEQEEVLEESATDTDWRETDAESGGDRYGVPEVFSDDLPTDNMGRSVRGESDTRDGEHNATEYYADWTDTYQEARGYLYGTPETESDAEAAYEIMREEAEKGNAYAMHDMGKIYAQGIFVEPDQETAEAWYHRSLTAMFAVEQEKANIYLEYRIGKMYQYGLGTEENLAEAAEWFLLAAQKEHKFALYSLGMLYLHGKGVEQDGAEAFRLFLRSYRKGNPYAAYELGKLYEAGRGTERNLDKAESCYHVAFLGFLNLEKKAKDDTLWYRIGSMYLHGIGTEADEVQAEKYLTLAADYGNPHAAYQLAKLYIRQETNRLRREPEEIPDYEKIKKAAAWLRKAAEEGNPSADYALGKLYGDGILTARDMDRAFFHLQRAAAAGNVYAQSRLGRWYLEEEYKNIPQAVHYLTMAADRKGDLYRNYAGIAKKYYGYETAVIDLRNPTRSDGDNMLHLVNKYMDEFLADGSNLSAKAKAEKYAKITAKTIISSGGADSSSYGQNAFFYDAAEGVLTAAILLIAEFCPDEKRHIISVFKLIQDLLAPSKIKGKNQFQLLMAKLPDTHKAKWFAGAALNTAEQSMQSVLSTALSRLNSFLDSELEQILCFDTAIDEEQFCRRKTAVFLVMPEEDNTKYFIISLILQQLYREILVVADENGGKLDNRVVFYWDEVGTIPKIESAEMMFSASRSRKVSIVPMIQSFAQLNKNYGKEGAEIIIDNCQDTIFGGFAPNSESAEVLSKSLGNRTVLSGSISRGKNDPSQSLQMMQRSLMTPDELKSLPKGNFIVSKTGCHPMQTKLKLFLKWGITFEEPYEIEEKSARKVAYADKQEIEEEIIRRYMCCMEEDAENTDRGAVSRNGGMQQAQMNETVARVRQSLRTED